MSNKNLKGAASTTHRLKEYGHGISMEVGLKRLQAESKREGFQYGVNFLNVFWGVNLGLDVGK